VVVVSTGGAAAGALACAGQVTVPPLITYAKATPAPTMVAAATAPSRRNVRLLDLVLTS
jgi:hypothetical protein